MDANHKINVANAETETAESPHFVVRGPDRRNEELISDKDFLDVPELDDENAAFYAKFLGFCEPDDQDFVWKPVLKAALSRSGQTFRGRRQA